MKFPYNKYPKSFLLVFSCLGLVLISLVFTTHFNIKGHFDGVYLLHGENGSLLELKDDLYLGDGSRVILSIDLLKPQSFLHNLFYRKKHGDAYLSYEWDPYDGSGIVRNHLSGGNEILTSFSRFRDEDGNYAHGLIVGGGQSPTVKDNDLFKMNETGMAFNDGKRWYHLWCTANEGISSSISQDIKFPPQWKFLGSRVVSGSDTSLDISSNHEAIIDGVPLRIDRSAYFIAGQNYFTLIWTVTNVGLKPVGITYLYGDEPWLGNYGSSGGNVGWVKDRIVQYESRIDARKYSWAGMFDYGNGAIGEGHDFTLMANFIEWKNDTSLNVYFSNYPGKFDQSNALKRPLSGDTRYLGLEWGPTVLKPGENKKYGLSIGMAILNPKTGLPDKPNTILQRQFKSE